jgi:uncharacterized protein
VLTGWIRILAFAVMIMTGSLVPSIPRAQDNPIEFLLRQREIERERRNIIAVPRAARQGRFEAADRAQMRARPRVQRQPRRVKTASTRRKGSIGEIIEQSEPSSDNADTRRLPPLAGLQLIKPSEAPASVPTANRKRLMIIGDSIGIQLGQGLREAFADRPDIEIMSHARADTGLVNPGNRNLPEYLAEVLPRPDDKPDLVLIMTGTNDNQKLRDAGGSLADPLSDGWREAYSARIDAILQPVKTQRIPAIWVGLPQMRSEKLSNAALGFNGLYRERVQRAGFTYRDIWEGFTTETGVYAPDGPSVDGEIMRLRAGDGVHFTRAGSRKLAFFVERDIRNLLQSGGAEPSAPALPFANPQSPGAAPAAPLVLEGDVAPAFPAKPAAGPTISLTAEPTASELVGAGTAGGAAETSFGKPGRADDFSWPQ